MAETYMDPSSCSVIMTQFRVTQLSSGLMSRPEPHRGERQSLSPDSGVPLGEARS